MSSELLVSLSGNRREPRLLAPLFAEILDSPNYARLDPTTREWFSYNAQPSFKTPENNRCARALWRFLYFGLLEAPFTDFSYVAEEELAAPRFLGQSDDGKVTFFAK